MPSREIGRWDEHVTELEYCERCHQVFISFDIFYDHRESSDEPEATDWTDEKRFVGRRTLEPGEELPEDAIVGKLEPCKEV